MAFAAAVGFAAVWGTVFGAVAGFAAAWGTVFGMAAGFAAVWGMAVGMAHILVYLVCYESAHLIAERRSAEVAAHCTSMRLGERCLRLLRAYRKLDRSSSLQ